MLLTECVIERACSDILRAGGTKIRNCLNYLRSRSLHIKKLFVCLFYSFGSKSLLCILHHRWFFSYFFNEMISFIIILLLNIPYLIAKLKSHVYFVTNIFPLIQRYEQKFHYQSCFDQLRIHYDSFFHRRPFYENIHALSI